MFRKEILESPELINLLVEYMQLQKISGYIYSPSSFVIEELEKLSPKPLFKTDDGVEIYSGDEFWIVNLLSYSKYSAIAKHEIGDSISIYKCFSTKEKAEDYISLNKPCFSLKEVIVYVKPNYIKLLRSMVKSKINL